jgi:hypothetical protein
MRLFAQKNLKRILGIDKYLIFIKLQNGFQKLRKRMTKAKKMHVKS